MNMETPKTGPEPIKRNYLEKMQYEVANVRTLIDAEFTTTINPWLACVASRLQTLMGNAELAQNDNLITEEQAENIFNKLKVILKRQRELFAQYKDQKDIPEEIKEELVKSLSEVLN